MFKQPSLGEFLKKQRYAKNVSLDGLAKASGVSVATIASLENGSRVNVTILTLGAICTALGIDKKRLVAVAAD